MLPKLSICLFALLLLAPLAWGSDARINGTGGLSLVLDDESASINPFTLGNPAGLSLLPAQSRLDATVQYFYETIPGVDFQRHYFSTLGDLTAGTPGYNGLLLFATPRFAIQLDSDYLYTEGLTAQGLESSGNSRVRGFGRMAYNFGPFVLGGEFVPAQTTSPVIPQPSGGGQIVSGSDNTNAMLVNGGLLVCFPSDPGPQQDRFEIGGIYSYQLTPPQEEVDVNVIPVAAVTPSPVTVTVTDTTVQYFGPEAYFESPGSLQVAVLSRITQYSTNFQLASPDTTLVPTPQDYKSGDGSGFGFVGLFKSSTPLGRGLSLKTGGEISYGSSKQNSYDPAGTAISNGTIQDITGRLGVGAETLGDFTVGLQGALDSQTGSTLDAAGTNIGNINYQAFSLALGGEKWLSKQLAFRVGFQVADQKNNGDQPFSIAFFPNIKPGTELTTTSVTAGLGFKEGGFYSDLTLSDGQVVSVNSSYFATQLSAQWAAGYLFN